MVIPSTRLSGISSKLASSLDDTTGLVVLLECKHEKQFPIDR